MLLEHSLLTDVVVRTQHWTVGSLLLILLDGLPLCGAPIEMLCSPSSS